MDFCARTAPINKMGLGMNVWIWGPSMWEILHASSFVADKYRYNMDTLINLLPSILPCIYCRESCAKFKAALGRASTGHAAQYCYVLHNTVNAKLQNQKVDAFLSSTKWSETQKDMFRSSSSVLFSQPSFEVVEKRFLVNSDESFLWKDLSIVLLALCMSEAPIKERNEFIRELIKIIRLSKQANASMLIETLEILVPLGNDKARQLLDKIKYNEHSNSELIRAGACIKGTCA
jgi:hypothetical protein